MDGTDSRLHWEERSRRLIASSPVFELSAAVRTSADGRSGEFWVITAPDWVNVVPLLHSEREGDRFLMVRQFRHGARMITTEFPAGLVEPGEDPRRTAARELEEETGYRAGRLTHLGRISPNPAFMNNWCDTYLAEDLVSVAGAALDELESLVSIAVPVAEVQARMGTGEYTNSLAVVALHWFNRHRDGAS